MKREMAMKLGALLFQVRRASTSVTTDGFPGESQRPSAMMGICIERKFTPKIPSFISRESSGLKWTVEKKRSGYAGEER